MKAGSEQNGFQLGNKVIEPGTDWFDKNMCKLLRACIHSRFKLYQNTEMETDREALEHAKAQIPR